MDTRHEQAQLRFSIVVTLLLGASCVLVGLALHSQAVAFDGFYSLIDVVLTTGSLAVSRLVASGGSARFQFGFWHFEPMVVVFNASVLALACVYAGITAVQDLLKGGHELAFGLGAAWAAFVGALSLALALYMRRQARRLASALLKLDAQGWLIGGAISVAVLLGFGVAAAMRGGAWDGYTRYIDSTVLLLAAMALLPLPLGSLIPAMRELLQVAPDALDLRVRAAMDAVQRERGYLAYASHVAKVGRMRFIDIHVLVDADAPLRSVAELDAARADMARRIGADARSEWLTIVFTTRREWM